MIDTNQRVVFLAENHAGVAPWYHPPKVPQLTDPAMLAASCRLNRGPARAPLFLVNHWISTGLGSHEIPIRPV